MPHILLILVIVHISHEDFLEGWNVVFSSLLGTCVHYSVVSDCDPMDCSLPGSSVREILQARILEWVTHSLFQGIVPTH